MLHCVEGRQPNKRLTRGCRLVTCFKDWFHQPVSCRRCTYSDSSSSAWCGAMERCSSWMIEPKWSSSCWNTSPSSTIPNSKKMKPYSNTSWTNQANSFCSSLYSYICAFYVYNLPFKNCILLILPRGAMHKHSLCRHAVSGWMSVTSCVVLKQLKTQP